MKVLESLGPEAVHVKANETTEAYYFYSPIDQPDTIFGLELYEDLAYAENVHMTSEPFKAFVAGAGPHSEKPFKLDAYEPADVGFVTRPGFSKLQDPEVLLLLVYFTAAPGKRDAALELFKPVAADVWENEPEAFSYYFMKSVEEPDKFAIFERYKNRAALEVTHRSGEAFKTAFKAMADQGLISERIIHECVETGVGYLDKE
ncbi:uncharacterized protein V1518DRAFT_374495 [Limtongia smithiae]|uniref:uncharacterized protein n=1 Tax=Limtongia smithiae TaxID=1125753 RepID=UPI0034CE5E3E